MSAHSKCRSSRVIFVEECNWCLHDVPCRSEPPIMMVWQKKEKPVVMEVRLVPWK